MENAVHIAEYEQLVELLRIRKTALNISDLELDDRIGLTRGHFGKIVNGDRGVGMVTLMPLLFMLGIDLHATFRTPTVKFEERRANHARDNHQTRRYRKLMRELGAKGLESMRSRGMLAGVVKKAGKARMKSMTKAQRSAFARRAAWARWSKAA